MLPPDLLSRLDDALAADDAARERAYPGPQPDRQPVHTVYVPAHQVGGDTVRTWGAAAQDLLTRCGPLPDAVAAEAGRVVEKLAREPVEDLRVDTEDGYGPRPDAEEDADARSSAVAVASMVGEGTCPPFVGVRIKSLEPATRARSVRTLDLFLTGILTTLGELPAGFRVTLPKVTSPAQVTAMVTICEAMELAHGIRGLRFEIQVETPAAVLGADGRALVAPMLHAAAGRCAGLHYGTYDYSAALGIAAAQQSLSHPAADHAKAIMQVAAAGTGVPVCDGSTNVLPRGTVAEVRSAWAVHARLVRRSLERGFYQGWDLHPGHLPTRFATTFAFFREGADGVAARLRTYLARAESRVLDEPATAAAMAAFLCRGIDAGALDPHAVASLTGIPPSSLLRLAGRQVRVRTPVDGGAHRHQADVVDGRGGRKTVPGIE